MIETTNISKSFGEIKAVDDISAQIKDGLVFGLVGTNGAGKSTFIRMLAGILKPDSGAITIDGQPVYAQTDTKARCFYISDDQFYFGNSTPAEMRDYYQHFYSGFDKDRYNALINAFGLDARRKINTFSRGMKKQAAIIAALAANTPYIFCDETFDGLDPVMRQAVKSIFAAEIASRGLTPVIASHNLRELEDICDHVGLLHKGGMLLSRELEDMKVSAHKIHAIFPDQLKQADFPGLDIVSLKHIGSMHVFIVRGDQQTVSDAIAAKSPLFMETLPLTLEEIFISETEVVGYDIKSILS